MITLVNSLKNIFLILRLSFIQIIGIVGISKFLGLILNIDINFNKLSKKKISFVKFKNQKKYYLNKFFIFGNKKISLVDNWVGGHDLLFNFNIHYFDYIHHMNDEDIIYLLNNWNNNIKSHYSVSSHPYVISRRLINLSIYLINSESNNLNIIKKIIKSDYKKVISNLEFKLRNNHLSSNLTAIYIVMNLFSKTKKITFFNKFFESHINAQILFDGCHIEQTPMYHHLFLQDLILINELNLINNINSYKLSNAMFCMNSFNNKLNPGLYECSYFNDSNDYEFICSYKIDKFIYDKFDVPNNLDYKNFILKKSGYHFVDYLNINFIFFDSSVVNKFNPGHIHSGLLPYEIYKNGKKIITNLGIFDYNINNKRHFLRSDVSKNTSFLKELSFGIFKSFRIFYFPILVKLVFVNKSNNYNYLKIYYKTGLLRKIKYKRCIFIIKNQIKIFETSNIISFNSYINSNIPIKLIKNKKSQFLSFNFIKFPYFYSKEKVLRYKLKTFNHSLFYTIKF